MMACGYFNKQVPRLLRNKENKEYERYTMGELKGRTMGIVGYGDIGQTTARLAKAYGMRVLGLRRHPELSADDPLLDQVVGSGEEELLMLMRESDYLLVCAPLTPETNKMIGEKQLINARKGQVLINVGRGALLDEEALAAALQVGFSSVLDHRALMPLSSAWILTLPPPPHTLSLNPQQHGFLAGAALDVFTVEPLPKDSPLWTLPNVLLSPHNADMTVSFRHDSVKLFCTLCTQFLHSGHARSLPNQVDVTTGY